MTEEFEYFKWKCHKGLEALGLSTKKEYVDRLEYEVGIIKSKNIFGYFLIVADFVQWAKDNGVPVGPGRGSGCGSLCAYCLHITGVDPIKYNLLFERFINPERMSYPDLDLDFGKVQRDKVVEYLASKYGEDKVAHIGTFGLLRAKAAVRTATRVLGQPYPLGDSLTKLILPPIHGKALSLKESICEVKQLSIFYSTNCPEGDILKAAEKIENHISNVGVHASGVVISNDSLLDTVPLFRGNSDEITCQWDMGNIEEVGLIKFDILGLATLDKIKACTDLIKTRHNKIVDVDALPLDDKQTFDTLRAGESVGIFQVETSSGCRDLLVQIRPTSLEDVAILVAAYRPGPLGCAYKPMYLEIRAGKRQADYLVPELEPLLKSTDGWLIYQEQAMAIAKQLCGYTGGEADDLRKAIGKKIAEKMAKHEGKFKSGWVKHGLPSDAGDKLWADIVNFAAYSFNKSHALAYGMITYQTAYLKTHYPVEFMCAVMNVDADNHDQMIVYLAECRRLGIKVMPPDINASDEAFTITGDKTIQFGLGPIKNIGASAAAVIIERKNGGRFLSIKNFCERVDLSVVNRLKIDTLIRAGTFDSFGHNKASLLATVEDIWSYRDSLKCYVSKLETYEKKIEAHAAREEEMARQIKEEGRTKLRSFKPPVHPGERPAWPEVKQIDELPVIEMQMNEHELLGSFVSSHPLDWTRTSQYGRNFHTIQSLQEGYHDANVSLLAIITGKKEITTKKNKAKMANLKLEDLTGTIEATVFPKEYAKLEAVTTLIRVVRIDAQIDVTETDEDKIVKLKVKNISPVMVEDIETVRKIEIEVPLEKTVEMLAILKEYSGDKHEVSVVLKSYDGTHFRLPESISIGNQQEKFLQEIKKLNA